MKPTTPSRSGRHSMQSISTDEHTCLTHNCDHTRSYQYHLHAPTIPISKPRNQCRGFTLLEILIALFIFTIIAVITTTSLRTVLNVHERVQHDMTRLQQLQVAMTLLAQDTHQIIDRPIINAQGQRAAALILNNSMLTFTRAGNINPLSIATRSNLLRISYYLEDGQLIRAVWPSLDAAPNTKPSTRVLLNHVTALTMRVLDAKQLWQIQWPEMIPAPQQQRQPDLPVAVEYDITIEHWGTITRLFTLSGVG